MQNQSKYDPSRKTIGAIYRDLQMHGDKTPVINGDLTNELKKSLVEDLNTTIASNPFNNKPFYITVHEKKDMTMPRALLRRIIVTKYRPYPEDDTVVFWVEPESNTVEFCWCLPHHTEMNNMLANEFLFEKEMISQIKAWKAVDLYHFGFAKDEGGNWIANPHFKDKKMKAPNRHQVIVPFRI